MIYFDNAATTKPSAGVVDAIVQALEVEYGNPSSGHLLGVQAHELLEQSRQEVASVLGAQPNEIIFTSGGTEADNLTLQGVCAARPNKKRVVISAVEHDAVYKTCRFLKRKGYDLVKIPIGIDGSFDEAILKDVLSDDVALVSVMYVNNETGTILSLRQMVDIVKRFNPEIPFHTDAVQAFGKVAFTVDELGVDLLSISAHKIHGPKGIGALYVREGTPLLPTQFGGGQERTRRSGTEAMPLIAGFGVAVHEAVQDLDSTCAHVLQLREKLTAALQAKEGIVVNSDGSGVPHIVNFSVPKKDPDEILKFMSDSGICISRGAACKSNHTHGPSMLMSFGLPVEVADTALRVSFSHENTCKEVDTFITALNEVVF